MLTRIAIGVPCIVKACIRLWLRPAAYLILPLASQRGIGPLADPRFTNRIGKFCLRLAAR